jgi:hypothetical protein
VVLAAMHEPHVKHLDGNLWEMRMKGKDGIARAIYVTAERERVVVVHAFVKKTQKTPARALDTQRAFEQGKSNEDQTGRVGPRTESFQPPHRERSARSVLMGERTALNFVQRMTGIATLARRYVDAIPPGCRTRIIA